MADSNATYTQIHIQFVFAVKFRDSLIKEDWKEELHKYITGIVQNNNHKLLVINSMPDHVHILVGMRPKQSVSDLVMEIKTNSSKFINDKNWINGKFSWQEGYGAFSYSKSSVDAVVKYILNQEEHHKNKSFKEEYLDFLNKFEIEYDSKYLFDWIE